MKKINFSIYIVRIKIFLFFIYLIVSVFCILCILCFFSLVFFSSSSYFASNIFLYLAFYGFRIILIVSKKCTKWVHKVYKSVQKVYKRCSRNVQKVLSTKGWKCIKNKLINIQNKFIFQVLWAAHSAVQGLRLHLLHEHDGEDTAGGFAGHQQMGSRLYNYLQVLGDRLYNYL